jgi:outer membrane lipoprotein-sorting protein
MLRKNSDDSDMNQKYYTLFKRPADVRKMVFMVHKHAALTMDDDRWLYLPGLDLVKRIAASDKRTSFVGSDFLYEDISGRSPEDDFHELIETTAKYYVVKNTPKKPESVEFAYYIAYIDKKNFIPMKMEFFKQDDRAYRIIEALQVDAINAEKNGQPVTYPTVTISVAKDLENGSHSEMTYSNVHYNVGIGDKIFSERYLRRPPRDAMR